MQCADTLTKPERFALCAPTASLTRVSRVRSLPSRSALIWQAGGKLPTLAMPERKSTVHQVYGCEALGWATHGALPHRAPSPRCTADRTHHRLAQALNRMIFSDLPRHGIKQVWPC